MTNRRVVITGLGIITSLGQSVDEYWKNLADGKSGMSNISRFDTTRFDVHFGSEVKEFDPCKWMDAREARRLDRVTQFGLAAASQVIADSAMDIKGNNDRIGVIIGSGIGGLAEFEEQSRRLSEKGPAMVSAFFIPKLMLNAIAGQIAIRYRLRGANFSVASACASANHAMGMAFKTIRSGEADAIVTGGCEAALTPMGLAGFAALKALSTRNDNPQKASRPFDKDRDGFVLSEGAGMALFEELEHAQKRGAKIYAEVIGFGMSCDGHHITAPDPDGSGGAMAMADVLKDAGLKPSDVTYINAHGTSTQLNDVVETRAIKKVFGDYAKKIPISSTKSMVGHMLGAAGGAELIAMILAVKSNVIHPTINYENPDPECDLDYVPNKAREAFVDAAISNSLGFGGHNATIAIKKYK